MKKFLLPENGQFYKANLHCHTTCSDGKLSPEEVKRIYKEHGYSVIAYTDHDVLLSHSDLDDENFLALHGYEMEVDEKSDKDFSFIKTCHMCFIALKPENMTQVCYHRTKYLFGNAPKYRSQLVYDDSLADFEREYTHEKISEMMQIGRDNGFFVTYNHPVWSLENYANYSGYNNMNAMEIVNNSCVVGGFPEYNENQYDDMLRLGKRIYCTATDDNHNVHPTNSKYCDSFGGFTMIKAPKLEYTAITDALVNGNFYASQGPEIHSLTFENGKLSITCSPAESIVLTTGRRRTKAFYANTEGVTQAEFDVFKEDGYVRITVTDQKGKHANTNAYFCDELF